MLVRGISHVGVKAIVLGAALTLALAACGSDSSSSASTSTAKAASGPATVRVPQDEKTIQDAVDAAANGSLILISPGTYREAVIVNDRKDLTLRGLDRNTVVLDGEFKLANGVAAYESKGIAIENMTARNYVSNGFYWKEVDGYRGSYLTSIRTGDYGIYARASVNGQFDHSYGAGSPDAGFYVGECDPCNMVITDSEAEWNGLGYSGTNSGGKLYVVNNSFHGNRAGVVPNSGTGEKLFPQHDTTVAGNVVYNNNNEETSAISIAVIAVGNGILVAGGNENLVVRNLVYGHDIAGIAVIPLPEQIIDPKDKKALNFDAKNNRVEGNVARDNKQFDFGLVSTLNSATESGGNCFSNNVGTIFFPTDLQEVAPCDGPAGAFQTDIGRFATLLGADHPKPPTYRKAVLPKAVEFKTLPSMPNAATAPTTKTRGPSIAVDVDTIRVPTVPGAPAAL